jgi:hypothetical protein
VLQDISLAVEIIDSSFKSAPAAPFSAQLDSATLLGTFGVLFRSFESAEWTNESIETAPHETPGGTTGADEHLKKVFAPL